LGIRVRTGWKKTADVLTIITSNWVPLLFVAAMTYMHFGMSRGRGHSGHGACRTRPETAGPNLGERPAPTDQLPDSERPMTGPERPLDPETVPPWGNPGPVSASTPVSDLPRQASRPRTAHIRRG
jgi:hypothetical protein